MAVLPLFQQMIWKLAPATTLGMALNSATQRLKDAEIDPASLDAQVLLAHTLGVERTWLFAHYEYELSSQEAERFTELIARRMSHEPVAYLTGRREFYGLDLVVDKRVLIPRPETEMLVDEVLMTIESRQGDPVRVADVGTGSGAIALAVATSEPRALVYATDISRTALAVAHANVKRLDSRGQVKLLRGDLLAPISEPMDVIVANLPYIDSTDYQTLDVTVRNFEPRLALESGPAGLDAISRLLRCAPAHLARDGVIYLEIGSQQAAAVSELAAHLLPHAREIEVHQDYQGLDRMVAIAF